MPPRPPAKDDILAHLEYDERGCWLWTGDHRTQAGYPIWKGRRSMLIHRIAYEMWIGPIPKDPEGTTADLDHRCNNKNCVNPYHRMPVSRALNTQLAWVEKHRQMPWKHLRVARELHNQVGRDHIADYDWT